MKKFYDNSPPFRWFKKGCESMSRSTGSVVDRLVKLVQEKVWLGDRTDRPDGMTIAIDWDVKHQTKHKKDKNEKGAD